MNKTVANHQNIGSEVHRFCNVPVFENGADKNLSHGRHFSLENEYYYGQKWQCVEYVKRFYDQALNHKMPHVWGHAKDFFDRTTEHGDLNTQRGLTQYKNMGNNRPNLLDILVFSDTLYGHLAIVSDIFENTIEVVQQNITGKPVQFFTLQNTGGKFFVNGPRTPDGWLRLESRNAPRLIR